MVDAFQNDTGLASSPRPIRKKFAKPPVKVACLPWCVRVSWRSLAANPADIRHQSRIANPMRWAGALLQCMFKRLEDTECGSCTSCGCLDGDHVGIRMIVTVVLIYHSSVWPKAENARTCPVNAAGHARRSRRPRRRRRRSRSLILPSMRWFLRRSLKSVRRLPLIR